MMNPAWKFWNFAQSLDSSSVLRFPEKVVATSLSEEKTWLEKM
jgi:hypothetical protein